MAATSHTNGSGRAKTKASGASSAKEGDTPARDYSIAAVDRALDLLEALARTGPVPLATLADAAGCTRTAGFRLLRTLQARGFAIQDEARGLWRLGARWSALGRAAAEQGALAATSMPHLAALGKASGENAYLRIRQGMECETVAIYQTDPMLRVYTEVGKRLPLHAGTSRILLAYAPEAVQTQVLAQRLPRFTPATRTDAGWIAADLHRIRTRGYLITADEVTAGAVSVGAPVRDATGQVVAVISISAPSMRMRPPRPRSLIPIVLDAADRLSRALGADVPEADHTGAIEAPRKVNGNGSANGQNGWTMPARPPVSRPHTIFR